MTNISRNKAALNEHFVPAYESLIEGLKNPEGKGNQMAAACVIFPKERGTMNTW